MTSRRWRKAQVERGGYWATWRKEIRSSRPLDQAKALLLATRDRTLYILQKSATP